MPEPYGLQRLERLRWPQALLVYKFSRRYLPSLLCRKLHTLFALLFNLERAGNNLSMGLWDGDEMVGYMLVYFHDRSLYHQRKERIVHIDEYCVAEPYRHWGKDFLEELARQMDLTCKSPAVEALATEESTRHWLLTQRFMKRRMNYSTVVRENERVQMGHSLSRIRWDFIEGGKLAPESPLPMTKKSSLLKLNNSEYQVVITHQPRQWLTLREQVATIFSEHQQEHDQFAWQWWRYFGIGKELCVVAVYKDEQLQLVAPWYVAFGASGRSLQAMGGEGYEIAQPLLRKGIDLDLDLNLELEQALRAHVSQAVKAQNDFSKLSIQSARPRPVSWLGANRAACDLHNGFQQTNAESGRSHDLTPNK